jgi:hypothetical protein
MTTHTAFDFTPLLAYRPRAAALLARLNEGDASAITEGRSLFDGITEAYDAASLALVELGEDVDVRTADGLYGTLDCIAGVTALSVALDVAEAMADPDDDTPAGLRHLHDLSAPMQDARMAALLAKMEG